MVAETLEEMTRYGKTEELPEIKVTKIAVHPDAVFTSQSLSSLIKTALTLHYTQLNYYITKENLFDIMNESHMPDFESSKISQRLKKDQAFCSYQYDSLNSEKLLNNEKYITKETSLDIMNEKSILNHKSELFDSTKMNLISILNDQDSNDQDFYYCQYDKLNFENIYYNDNISLTKDDQCSAMELVPSQYSTMDLMPFQYTTTNLIPFQYSTTDSMLFQNNQILLLE
ncbi:28667_t:CDS:2 [Racocetra persica]|uniref:28667_t:CDS:1 n=1 Tax=Racocetra persica TaxID=160502 RepID=A0ACA9M3K2_9GLOM|nr:28667_t:CDS:2 [Racocetra persica]